MQRDRTARAAAQRRSTQLELELLRRGVEPHFMLNTLNSLAEWVESDPARGVRMIESLGNQMRALAAVGERDTIPLGEEIDLVRSYLELMSFRSDAPFTLAVNDVPPAVATPPGVLLTLAENAFSHNRYPNGAEFRLDVAADDAGVRLVFETPPAAAQRNRNGGGAGHAYVRGRLAAAFGDRARFRDGPTEDGRWQSLIEYPATKP
jgi:LytS/YehU family sensor histidine kinase